MQRPRTLPAFSPDEVIRVHRLLATHVAYMMGRKLEEGDWADVYCTAKSIPNVGWSNLNIDVMHDGLGVEHKMLRRSAGTSLRDLCGMRLMHPAATRAIRIPSLDSDPNAAMTDILTQYTELLAQRSAKVQESAPGKPPDMRTGWLLWEAELREFLYFEEETVVPDPKDYVAQWKESRGGIRKSSKNLWVYEKETGHKRFSITTSAGAKIQPYFDVPPPTDPNVYIFRVQGEKLPDGFIRVWITVSTERELRRMIGEPSIDNLRLAIETAAAGQTDVDTAVVIQHEEATSLLLDTDSYELLTASLPGVSDEHMFQLLVERLRQG